MHSSEAISRSDRVLVGALAIVLATASAALGSALTYHAENRTRIVSRPEWAAPKEVDPVLVQLIAEHRCLSEALYYEARGEGRVGEKAVAEVIFHRLRTGHFGNSICAVVYEGASRPGCQFSFTCNGDLDRRRDESAWTKSQQLAAKILTGEVTLHNTTDGATHYHATWISPYWAPTFRITAQIGNHVFYRPNNIHKAES